LSCRTSRLLDELEWWESGKRFFGFDGDQEGEPEAQEKAPEPVSGQQQSFISNGSKPTLREAIMRVIGEQPKKTWQTEEVLTALRKRGWISDAKNADQHARSKMGEMHRKGDLRRIRRGHYRLPPNLQRS
jgi:hypothetical protein